MLGDFIGEEIVMDDAEDKIKRYIQKHPEIKEIEEELVKASRKKAKKKYEKGYNSLFWGVG